MFVCFGKMQVGDGKDRVEKQGKAEECSFVSRENVKNVGRENKKMSKTLKNREKQRNALFVSQENVGKENKKMSKTQNETFGLFKFRVEQS